MNIYVELNKIIEYIENHLEEKIDYKELSKNIGVNEYTFQKIFSVICNISISEYIRNRRLSNAGQELFLKNEKVVDIAIKYQYNNPTAFSRAFEKFHGIKPSMVKKNPEYKGWMRPKKEISSLDEILKLWNKVNYTTTERNYDCINVSKSDTLYGCENVYRSQDCRQCKNTVFTDSCGDSEYIIACQRSGNCSYCIRVDDSNNCSNSYSVICSAKISNSFFIQDANSLHECMFCSHISNRRYCIANMQFSKEEYFAIKAEVLKWIVSQFAIDN